MKKQEGQQLENMGDSVALHSKEDLSESDEEGFDTPKEAKKIWDFSQPTDLILVVEEKELHVHKSLLVNASPVFKVMLESENFVEKDKQRIELPEKKWDDVLEMLHYLYLFQDEVRDEAKVENMLKLSREYDIQSLKDICENYLINQEVTIDHLLTAQEFGLDQLKEKCLNDLAMEKLENIENHALFKEIQQINFNEISYRRTKRLEELYKVFKTDYRNVEHLLVVSSKNNIGSIKKMCECHLMNKKLQVEHLLKAQKYQLDRLKEKCLDDLALKKLKEIKSHIQFCLIEDENLHEISNRRVKELERIFQGIVNDIFNDLLRNMDCKPSGSSFDEHVSCCKKCRYSHLIKAGLEYLNLEFKVEYRYSYTPQFKI